MNPEGTWRGVNIREEVLEAEMRIRPYIRETPLEGCPYLSALGNCQAFLKLETLQVTGSFKARGAANLILSLSSAQRNRGMVTSSTGNHGAAFAHFINLFGGRGTIYAPETLTDAKAAALQALGVTLDFYGDDCVKTEAFARKQAEGSGALFIPPYNHPKIIGGQGTVAVELERQRDRIDTVLVPVGGGGLMAGLAGYLRSGGNPIEIIGCQPENSPVMAASVRAGQILAMESLPTLADGTAGGIEPGSLTFEICRDCVDDFILVSEREIQEAILFVLEKHHHLIEGAAALSVAAFRKNKERFRGKHVVLLVTGKRIGLDALRGFLCASGQF